MFGHGICLPPFLPPQLNPWVASRDKCEREETLWIVSISTYLSPLMLGKYNLLSLVVRQGGAAWSVHAPVTGGTQQAPGATAPLLARCHSPC